VDILIARELTGGIYFGTPKERRIVNGEVQSVDTMIYTQKEIERISHLAFQTAHSRKGKVTSVDKANVLESSRLWRQVVSEVALGYPEVEVEHLLVDAAAMHLLTRPSSFDVILTTNMFGDILSDEASVLSGSLGNLPSASLGMEQNKRGFPRGLFEPIHGSAPDIAGKGIANPIGMILSLAMAFRYSLGLENEAGRIEEAGESVIFDGYRTADRLSNGRRPSSTEEMSNAILERI
jgi:3-isopropylmalate dehydrogenase